MKKNIAGAPFLLLSVFSILVRADGMLIKPFEDRWLPAREGSQAALIVHQNGTQRMLLTIEVENPEASDLVWIVPVPAIPGLVAVDILAGLAPVHGIEVFGGAKDRLGTMGVVAIGMQIWPAAVAVLVGAIAWILGPVDDSRGRAPGAKKAAKAAPAPELTVHQHVEKEGMVSEVITAKDGGALYRYLERKGLKIKPGAIPVLDHYVGQDYTFIASWLSKEHAVSAGPSGRANRIARGVEIRFPSREIFFPLRPTSVYGKQIVPATIRVAGYVTPRPFADIVSHMTTRYHVSHSVGPEAPAFVRAFDDAGNGRYTRIDIYAPSARFTDDLWISPGPPAGVGLPLATVVVRYPVAVFVLLVAATSALLSVVVGWVMYKELRTRPGAVQLAAIGLANCLTLLGMLAYAIRLLPGSGTRKAGFLACFSIAFIAIASVFTFAGASFLDTLRP